MAWRIKIKLIGLISLLVVVVTACSISYSFNGSSIDYTKVKTISFERFANRSSGFVWGPMESMFNTALVDIFLNQTKLRQVKRGGDLQFQGEITNYDAINKGVGSDGYSNMVELRMSVRVEFINNVNPHDNFKQTFTASKEYKSSQQLSSVQEDLVTQMIKDITEQIFNASVANW
ncbi:MAG: LPS assembly lipoprotein LptE [Phocaeicola sp.]|uniref:LptE family protein n=1 Tax=Phocaeicola TaxID=909656 RepID=UPI00234F1DEB|nr:LptE family protein [Phocaeicola oris]MCE2615678.1 LPS assembly lipoprotein LptE [Phocaeicola oris]